MTSILAVIGSFIREINMVKWSSVDACKHGLNKEKKKTDWRTFCL